MYEDHCNSKCNNNQLTLSPADASLCTYVRSDVSVSHWIADQTDQTNAHIES